MSWERGYIIHVSEATLTVVCITAFQVIFRAPPAVGFTSKHGNAMFVLCNQSQVYGGNLFYYSMCVLEC